VEEARESPHYKVLKAICLSNLGIEFDKAHRILDELLDEKNDLAVYAKAIAFLNAKDYDSAIEFFQKAYDLDPEKLMMAKEMREKTEQLKNKAEGKVLEVKLERIFICERCEETFKSSTDLSQHMLNHSR
jgi:tetratricopeptide (TPR) repeat protein